MDKKFYVGIRNIFESARNKANFAIVEAYWQVGKPMIEDALLKTIIFTLISLGQNEQNQAYKYQKFIETLPRQTILPIKTLIRMTMLKGFDGIRLN